MSSPGFTEEGLARLHEAMVDHVQRGAMPGLITLVARGGEVHVDTLGSRSFHDPEPLARGAIFRIASLGKPIAGAAAMALVDRGVLQLDDRVDTWLPELANRRVLTGPGADLDDTVPAERPITVDDLLTFRLGFGLVMAPPGSLPIQVAVDELDLRTMGPPWPPTPLTPDQWIGRLGSLPLIYQPGEQWLYNAGTQVLGVLLARAVGQSLERVLDETVFGPLGMGDTAFSVPPEKLDRLTTAYQPGPDGEDVTVLDGVADSYWSRPPSFPDASGWLVSTIDDYWAFVQMLLGGGQYRGTRVLTEEAVRLMTTDQLTAEQRAASALFLAGGGWGRCLRVPADGDPAPGSPGGFGWDGGTGTHWRSDLGHGLTGILFTQRAMTSPALPEVATDFWAAAYGSLGD